jgi:hypothetical protein
MTPVVVALCSVSAFLGLPLLAAATMRWSAATRPIYGACFVVCLVILVVALTQLLSAGSTVSALSLPLGLPWVGAHFRIDALAAFFLAVVNLGGASASLFAIGYGMHEEAPGRVLPFYVALLAGYATRGCSIDLRSNVDTWEPSWVRGFQACNRSSSAKDLCIIWGLQGTVDRQRIASRGNTRWSVKLQRHARGNGYVGRHWGDVQHRNFYDATYARTRYRGR